MTAPALVARMSAPSPPPPPGGLELLGVQLPVAIVVPPFGGGGAGLRAAALAAAGRRRGGGQGPLLLLGALAPRKRLIRHHHGEAPLELPLAPHLLLLQHPVVVVDAADGVPQEILRCPREHLVRRRGTPTSGSSALRPSAAEIGVHAVGTRTASPVSVAASQAATTTPQKSALHDYQALTTCIAK